MDGKKVTHSMFYTINYGNKHVGGNFNFASGNHNGCHHKLCLFLGAKYAILFKIHPANLINL